MAELTIGQELEQTMKVLEEMKAKVAQQKAEILEELKGEITDERRLALNNTLSVLEE